MESHLCHFPSFEVIYHQNSNVIHSIKNVQFFFSEPPLNLRVLNVTHREVHLEWEPGFHGGMDQYFRLQYHPNKLTSLKSMDESSKKYWDVYPANARSAIIRDLDPGVEYSIDVMSINNLGESNFTFKPVIVTTSSKKNS